MTSPEFLYRGTPRKDVDQFTPKEIVGGKLVVSASSDKTVAVKYVVPTEDLKVELGIFPDIHYYVCAEEDRFRVMDKGGAIYTLSPDGFEPAPDVGAGAWVNQNPVVPISKEEVSSALEAMIKAGVQVYFVPNVVFDRFINFPQNRREILGTLISENVKVDNI